MLPNDSTNVMFKLVRDLALEDRLVELADRVSDLENRLRLSETMIRLLPNDSGDFYGHLIVHPIARKVLIDGREVHLTSMEFDLALDLLRSDGALRARQDLLERIWGIQADIDTRTVDTHVSRLRRKLELTENRGWKLTSIRGYGYRLERLAAPDNPEG
jgi:DNA-binding response OmpR family regulator